jgi:hypothetical protein
MGHVASKTVAKTLSSHPQIGVPVIHTHWLSDIWLESFRQELQSSITEGDYARAKMFRRKLDRLRQNREAVWADNKRIKIVTLVREPVARAVSTLFYELDKEKPKSYWKQFPRLEEKHLLSFYDRLFDVEHNKNFYELANQWFDIELKPNFRLDLFEYPFDVQDRKRGYKIYRQATAQVLLIRVENLNSCYKDAFRDFFDIDVRQLNSTNQSGQKACAGTYAQFKQKAVIPIEILDLYYSLRYMSHFYSRAEESQFRRKWTRAD